MSIFPIIYSYKYLDYYGGDKPKYQSYISYSRLTLINGINSALCLAIASLNIIVKGFSLNAGGVILVISTNFLYFVT